MQHHAFMHANMDKLFVQEMVKSISVQNMIRSFFSSSAHLINGFLAFLYTCQGSQQNIFLAFTGSLKQA